MSGGASGAPGTGAGAGNLLGAGLGAGTGLAAFSLWRLFTPEGAGLPPLTGRLVIPAAGLLVASALWLLARRSWRCAVLAAALVALLVGAVVHTLAGYSAQEPAWHALGTDDAYITYRHARNLAAGSGLVFNAGERVEGTSSLLYTLLMAPAFLVTDGRSIYAWSTVLNGLCLLLAYAVFVRQARRDLGSVSTPAAACLFAAAPLLWMSVATGMETPLVLLLQLLLWVHVAGLGAAGPGTRRELAGLGLIVAALVVARADGFLMPAVATLFLAAHRRRLAALVAGLTLGSTLGLLTARRLLYYGYPLPNTYYVKISGPLLERWQDGLAQLRDAGLDSGLAVPLLTFAFLAAAAATRWLQRRRRPGGISAGFETAAAGAVTPPRATSAPPAAAFAVFFGLLWCLYFVYIGGDVYRERFLLILVPLGIHALLHFCEQRMRPAALILVVILVAAFQVRPLFQDRRFAYTWPKYDAWVTLGEFLGRARPGAVLAVDAAGKIPFFSRLPTIDMLGLTDVTIAHGPSEFFRVGHNKFDVRYVLDRQPDLIAVMSKDIDLNYRWGLDREAYTEAGYRLRYLLNCNPRSRGVYDVLDVERTEPDRLRDFLIRDYRYGVLERTSAAAASLRSSSMIGSVSSSAGAPAGAAAASSAR